ncbi:MAG: FAD-dependent oxidoreductase, partial [Chloroflexota bacterium]
VLRLQRELKGMPSAAIMSEADWSTGQFLSEYGFSEQFVELFFRGFCGGMFLDRGLSTSARCFKYDFKMLSEGAAVVPRDGMQAIPDQIAADLPEEVIRLNTPALRLEVQGGRVRGVQTSTEAVEADVVVLAAHAPEVQRLTGMEMPTEAWSTTCLYFGLPYPLYGNKKIILNGYPEPFVNNAVQISNIAASYAREAEHLLSVTVLGAPDLSAEEFTRRALSDLQRWFPWRNISGLHPLAVYQIPFARLVQPPNFHTGRHVNRTPTAGLYLAGEFTEASSLEGAMVSGEKAAAAVLGGECRMQNAECRMQN